MVKPQFSPKGRDARCKSGSSKPSSFAIRSAVAIAPIALKPSITSGVTGASLQPQMTIRCRPATISSTAKRRLYKKEAHAPAIAPVVPTLPQT